MAPSAREIYWSAILADFHRSGLTHAEFCRQRGISIHSFRSWLYRPRPAHPRASTPATPTAAAPAPAPPALTPAITSSSTPPFLPVHIRPALLPPATTAVTTGHNADSPRAATLELVLAHARTVRVPVGFDPETLHQLLDVLEQRS